MLSYSQKICSLVLLGFALAPQAFAQEAIQKAVAVVHPTKGNTVHGTVIFTKDSNGQIRVSADLKGLKPGKHGFHLHEFGDCSAPDGSSAGGHFNPTNKKHGCPDNPEHHAGDMGNIVADNSGNAHFEFVSKEMTFEGKNNIIGRAVIVHGDPDDCVSQPAGNAGARIGCGVIGIGK